MRRLPLLPTLIVALAVAAMLALGVWQIHRAQWKEALLARYAAARTMPPVAFPLGTGAHRADADALLFRRSSVVCLEAVAWSVSSGRDRAGGSGWRHVAECRTGAEGPGATVDIGWSAGFADKPAWKGGRVIGTIGPKPDHRSLIGLLLHPGVSPGVLLVADAPAPGLIASAPPSLEDIPNNHRAYAVQWFIFAGLAAAIYALALARRNRAAG